MPRKPSDLIVREHERFACAFDAVLRVESPGVALASAVTEGGAEGDMLRATMVDCSAGGAGLRTPVFLPRGCRVRLQVFHPHAEGGQVAQGWLLELPVRIQRVTMIARDPLYYLGGAFTGLDAHQAESLRRLLDRLAQSGAPAVHAATPGGGGGGGARAQ